MWEKDWSEEEALARMAVRRSGLCDWRGKTGDAGGPLSEMGHFLPLLAGGVDEPASGN